MATERTFLQKWIYAARPHTLGASVAPMLILLGALVLSDGIRGWALPYCLAFFVALFAQISSNLANDYFDYLGEKDTASRVGFERLLSSGSVTPREMLTALILSASVTVLCGVAFAYLEGWWILLVGLAVLLAMVGYSAGPFPLSHHGLGDIAVVLFYGIVPILVPYYVLSEKPTISLFLFALGIGIWEANILVCNNYRDYSEDLLSGKRTLVVRLGEKSGPWLYALNSLLSFLCFAAAFVLLKPATWAYGWLAILALGMGFLSLQVARKKGSALNAMLKRTNLFALFIGASVLALYLLAKFQSTDILSNALPK